MTLNSHLDEKNQSKNLICLLDLDHTHKQISTMSNTMTPDQCFTRMAMVLFRGETTDGEEIGYEDILQRVRDVVHERDTYKEHNRAYENKVFCLNQHIAGLETQLKQKDAKADAWDIHCEGEWEDVSRSWSAEQCRDLISCGACQESDFQRHEAYQEVKGSRVDMEEFEKLKQSGQMPWSK